MPGNVIDGMDFIADIALAFIAFSTGEFFKFDTLKKSGAKVMVITVFEAILASVLVFIITFFVLGLELNFSIVLAALASATAPASTVMTIRQTHAKGDFVDTLLQVVALDDVVGLVAYSIAISVALASATGAFHAGMDTESVVGEFGAMLSNPGEMTLWTELVVVAGFLICSFGLQNGLERVSKVMMLALLALIVVLAVHSLTLPGAAEGMKFYLLPSMDSIRKNGLGTIIAAAMNQSFFTLSLGIAAMEIFGSYMSDSHSLPGEAVHICALDTFVALMAGVIIFPACFSFGIETESGPALIFQTLPNVFVNMAGGRFWGALFFLFMIFASLSTVLAVFENILAICMDTFGWSRKKATVINGLLLLVLSLPCVFGYNLWANVHLIGGRDVLDTEDFLVSNLLLPIGAVVYLLFCVSRWGWGFENYLAEANTGKGPKLPRWLRPYFRYVLPLLIIVILVQGLL